jgi:hypothetical protein
MAGQPGGFTNHWVFCFLFGISHDILYFLPRSTTSLWASLHFTKW